ncbi:MAG: diguanylate cyclase [Gammaproteobacteria bacterium]|nr:diguanylate cyclase [Gammaproteobacteria bacterium]
MPFNNKHPFLVQISVALLYFLLAIIALKFAVIEGNATILWPSSGLALAVVITFGKRVAAGIGLGAFISGLYAGNSLFTSALIALGNTLEPLFAVYLLGLVPFSANLFHLKDYLLLVVAGSAGAVISALIGPLALVFAHFISLSDLPYTALYWWMGDILGVVLIAPFLLLFNFKIFWQLIRQQRFEALLLTVLTATLAPVVLAGFNTPDILAKFNSSYLLALPLIWSILRFGHIFTALISFFYFVIAIYGLLIDQGLFIDGLSQANLTLFWAYFVFIALISQTFAYISSERATLYQAINTSQSEVYIFCDDSLKFEFVNRTGLNNLGLSLVDALKLTAFDIKLFYSKQQFQELLAPLSLNKYSTVNYETVQQRTDGSLYPVEVTIKPIIHSSKQCYLATISDISERMAREQQRILGDQVCDLSPQAIMITDQDNKIIRVNAAFTEMTGYSAEEACGHNPTILSSGRHNKAFYKTVWQTLHEQGLWQGEIYNRRKNGELYLQNITIKVLLDANGKPEHYIAMFTDITHEREQTLHLKHLSQHDVLTDLPNRSLLLEEFQFAVASAKRNNTQLGLLFIDLNDFKPINDRFGHTYGDQVLQITATRMQQCIREMDMISRVGGDEFIVLVTNIENSNACQILIDKLKTVIAQPMIIHKIKLQVSASIGFAIYPDQANNFDDLLKIADLAMYKDKSATKQNHASATE